MRHAARQMGLLICCTFLLGIKIFDVQAQQGQQNAKTDAKSQNDKDLATNEQDDQSVVKISTKLIQIDAIVTDKKGNHLDDLNQNDFDLFVDGKQQPLTYFKLIRLDTKPPAPVKTKEASAPLLKMPAPMIKEEEVKRTLALVVDDLRLSQAGIYFAQDALKRFVATQVQDGDLVGIITTARGMGFYQQFTSDKRVLYAAINKLRWYPNPQGSIQFTSDSDEFLTGRNSPDGSSSQSGDPRHQADKNANDLRRQWYVNGTMGALHYVIKSLRALPGRKLIVALTPPIIPSPNDTTSQERMLRLSELANRASISFYEINPEGMSAPGIEASSSSGINWNTQTPLDLAPSSTDILRYLAYKTGGIPYYNTNDTVGVLSKAFNDSQSYYLLGFDPDDEKFDRRYHEVSVKVRRAEAQVRTREGFFGFPDSVDLSGPKTPRAAFLNALFSPFGARDITYQITPFLYHAENGEPVIRTYFHIDANALQFKDEADGKKSVTLSLGNFTFNESGILVENNVRSMLLNLDETRYRQAKAVGFAYVADFPVKKFGAFHFRSVVQDNATGKLGSANQYIEIPDLKRGKLALSGLTITGSREEQEAAIAASHEIGANDAWPIPAVRRLSRAGRLEYRAVVYNAQLAKQSGQPVLLARFEIYRAGKPVFQSAETQLVTTGQTDLKRIEIGGGLRLQGLPPDDYLLRVVVKDAEGKGRSAEVEQWMDFSVR